jgi:hypothetical protein
MYATAGLLWQILRLDEAAAMCEEVTRTDATKSVLAWAILSRIEARRGNLSRARQLAQAIEADPMGASYRVTGEELDDEHARGLAR